MKISELIEMLTAVKNEHGDLKVCAYNFNTEDGCIVRNVQQTNKPSKDFYFQGDAPCNSECCMIIGC